MDDRVYFPVSRGGGGGGDAADDSRFHRGNRKMIIRYRSSVNAGYHGDHKRHTLN